MKKWKKSHLLATIVSQNEKKEKEKVRIILHIFAVLCFKKYALTSVLCKIIMKVEKCPIVVNLRMARHNRYHISDFQSLKII